MPLLKGKKNIGHNIKAEENAGKDPRQALAIALNVARMSRKRMATGGMVPSGSVEHPKSISDAIISLRKRPTKEEEKELSPDTDLDLDEDIYDFSEGAASNDDEDPEQESLARKILKRKKSLR